MFNWLKKIVSGDVDKKTQRQYQPLVDAINRLESEYQELSNAQLREKTDIFRIRLDAGETLDDVLPEAFATIREASRRTIGMRHYDVQLIGGIVLHQGRITEMKTGEGKTLVATLPMYLNALAGEGVHLITVNDYLARRDAGWMGPVYHLLGLSVGFIGHNFSAQFDPDYVDSSSSLDDERLVHWRPCTRQQAYKSDITYGTNNEFGFDYLRDNLVHSFDQIVQGNHSFAIIDEVDNVLIDEARTPLIISGPASQSSSQYARFAELVRPLRAGRVTPDDVKKGAEPDGDVLIDLKSRSAVITEEGLAKVESQVEELGAGESLYDPQHSDLTHYLENALKAKFIYHRDKDYVVQEDEVIIVDEFTGRLMPGRRWSDGLHQAVEAKEGVHVRRESVTYATITFQNFFRMYTKLAGMTGTAATEEEEFAKIYNLEVTVVPTNKPCVREDSPDLIYRTEEAKFKALTEDIRSRVVEGQPILVGTVAVETSERLSAQLTQAMSDLLKTQQAHLHVLNAKQNADEASIVAQAGRPGTITIATNMAGRGTDILLGGNPEALASRYLNEHGFEYEELLELAESVLGGQKKQKSVPPKVIIERSNGRLDDELVEALHVLHAEYDAMLTQIEERGEHVFLMNALLKHIPPAFYEKKLGLVRAALHGNQPRARRMVREIDGLGEEIITDIRHMRNDYIAYRDNRRERPKILADKVFDRVYTARARLVQLTLRNDLEKAQELVADTPGLKAEHIDEILNIQRQCEEDHKRIKEKGGLHVVGTERHEARRIDNQLRGRAGRQGDPGSSRFYLSLEDDLMKRFGRMDALKGVMGKLGVEDDMSIESGIVSKSIESAQARVEGYNFDMRKHTVEYDDVMNKQREVIYTRRRRILEEAHEQDRIDTLLDRYLRPHQLQQEIHDEVRATTELDEDMANQRVTRLLPDVPFDLATLRAATDEEMEAILEPLIVQQQQHSRPILLDELSDMLDLPEDAAEHLMHATYQDATQYIHELWREQRDGDLEDRIKDLFDKEFFDLIERYLVHYESWLRDQISQAVADATSPTTDEVNFSLVKRRLGTVFPEIETFDQADMSSLSPDQIQRKFEGQIVAHCEGEHHIELLAGEIFALVPLLPMPQELPWQNLSPAVREHYGEHYITHYCNVLDRMTAALPQEEHARMRQEAADFLRHELHVLFNPAVKATKEDRERILNAILAYNTERLCDVISQSELDDIQEMLSELLNYAFDQWRDGIGTREMNTYQRNLMLHTIDMEWQQYLTAMDDMRQGIGLQAIGQRDPLIQYKTAGFRMFNELLGNIDHTIVHSFFQGLPNYRNRIEQYRAEQERQEQAAKSGYEMSNTGKSNGRGKGQTVRRDMPKVGPNDMCPCGSGKKYKYCHGRPSNVSSSQVQRGKSQREAEFVAVGDNGDEIAEMQPVERSSSTNAPTTAQRQRGRAAPPPPASSSSSTTSSASNKKRRKSKR